MLPFVIPVQRLQSPRIDYPVRHQRLGLVDMSQRHIVKSLQLFFFQRNVFFIPAVGQQDVIAGLSVGPDGRVQRTADLLMLIAEPVNPGIQLLKPDHLRLLLKKHMNIGSPGNLPVGGIRFQIIVIACHKDHLHRRDGGKQLVHLPQLPKERLPVEQISRDQQQLHPFFFGQLH